MIRYEKVHIVLCTFIDGEQQVSSFEEEEEEEFLLKSNSLVPLLN